MAIRVRRREFIVTLGSAATAIGGAKLIVSPERGFAQTNDKNLRIAVLGAVVAANPEAREFAEAFEQGMRTAGWIKDVNVRLDYWWAGTDPQRAAAAAAEVAGSKPNVIVAIGSPVVVPLHRATSTIPIVFAVVSDPVGQGLVSSLAHPGGNITGFSNFEPEMGGKLFVTEWFLATGPAVHAGQPRDQSRAPPPLSTYQPANLTHAAR
jgi:putative tryptophan/tyrosine transport system substrate-binding protein